MRRGTAPMRHPQRGATLAELLVVAAVMALVLGALVPLFTIGQQTWNLADRHADMTQNGRRALDKIIRDLRAAQSFQTVTPTLVRFRMALGDGTGGTPTVEYQLNAATGELEHRTSADYAYRRRITVTAGSAPVPTGYSASVVFNHAALVAAGRSLASGDDVRVLHWTGTKWVELDRFKDIPTAWNTATTRLWFRLQAPIPALGADSNYYLHYGDLAADPPPANGDYVFLDYEEGTTLAEWVDRDACSGTYATSPQGFTFNASSGSCHRQLSKNVAHGDAEIFWEFWGSGTVGDSYQVGVSARRSDTGVGYVLTLADQGNTTLRIRYWTVWSTTGGAIASTPASVVPATTYYGRFSLVGSTLRVKYWAVGSAEPGWMLTTTHSGAASGNHYGQVDGYEAPMNHRHRHLIIRRRVEPEPSTALGPEEAGARLDAFQPLAGPFRSMGVQCFSAMGNPTGCGAGGPAVRSVQVSLTVMDPTGEVADVVVTARAYRQAP